MEHFGKYLANKIRESGKTKWTFIGCSQEEIEEIMQAQGVKRLPRIYKEFLEVHGKKGVFLTSSSAWNCEDLKTLKQAVIDDLKMNNFPLAIPDDAFVFYSNYAGRIFYFLTDHEKDDCPVYLLADDDSEIAFRVALYRTSLREIFEEMAAKIAQMKS